MRRIFMQVYCRYPHGGASSNYLENLAKMFKSAGYSVILISDMNKEYSTSDKEHFGFFDRVYSIEYSTNEKERARQREQGFAKERIGILQDEGITSNDIVFTYLILNTQMLDRLFQYRDEIGFKVIAGVTEFYNRGEEVSDLQYEMRKRAREIFAEKADAVLTVSDFIRKYYVERGVSAFRIPPVIDCSKLEKIEKSISIKKFIISTGKDSFFNMLKAFEKLTPEELGVIEIHICGVKEEILRKTLDCCDYEKILPYMVVHKWLRYEELEALYKEMHFLLIAREKCQRTIANFPSKVPEMMAYGVVPIASDVGDYTKYYLEDGKNSIFIQGDSVEEIVKSIRKAIYLSEESYNQYSDAAMECARNRFDYHNWKEDIRSRIEKICCQENEI